MKQIDRIKRFYKMVMDLVKVSISREKKITETAPIISNPVPKSYWQNYDYSWAELPPIYVTAYVNVTQNINTLAKFPMIVAAQGTPSQLTAYAAIRAINPKIKMLCYVMIMDEVLSPGAGAGDTILLGVNNSSSWCKKADGVTDVTYFNGTNNVRLRDCRDSAWQTGLVAACQAAMNAFPFDGIFLDNCNILDVCSTVPQTRVDMRTGLNTVINNLRSIFLDKLIVGNGASYRVIHGNQITLSSLNGSYTEGIINDLSAAGNIRNYYAPIYNFYQDNVHDVSQITSERIKANAGLAFSNKMYYACQVDYHNFVFPDEYLEIIKAYNNK